MSLRRFSLMVIAMIVGTECGLAIWQYRTLEPSRAPVFSWPEAAAHFSRSESLVRTIDQYKCDRAAEYKSTTKEGIELASVYLEWDRIEAGPAMGFAAHGAELCNTAIGYKLVGIEPERPYAEAGKGSIVFDCTRFLDPAGRPVFMYKTAWVQGAGSWQLRDEGKHRFDRFKRSFRRTTGAGRVVLTAVYGISDREEAWSIFKNEVLVHLVWSGPSN